jgi:hypothetical protein
MGQPRQTTEEVHQNLCDLLDRQFAERNDLAVAQALHSVQGVDVGHGLGEAGLVRRLFRLAGGQRHPSALANADYRRCAPPVCAGTHVCVV